MNSYPPQTLVKTLLISFLESRKSKILNNHANAFSFARLRFKLGRLIAYFGVIFLAPICYSLTTYGQALSLPGGVNNISTATNGSVGVGLNSTTASATLEIRNRAGLTAGAGLIFLNPSQYSDMNGNPLAPAYAILSESTQGATTFRLQTNGRTYIGPFDGSGFTALPSNNLNIRSTMAVFGNDANKYLQMRLGSAASLEWRTDDASPFSIQCRNGGTLTSVLFMTPDGKVGIGTNNMTGQHSLYVKGSMIMEEAFVKLEANWPDYVFDADYELMPLKKLKDYIESNGKLPNLPSAEEVASTGIAIGETERLLTEKVEELTLYIIMLHDELEQLKAKLAE